MGEHVLDFSECFQFPENRNHEGKKRTNDNALDKSRHDYFTVPKQLNTSALVMHSGTFSPASMCTICIFKFSRIIVASETLSDFPPTLTTGPH